MVDYTIEFPGGYELSDHSTTSGYYCDASIGDSIFPVCGFPCIVTEKWHCMECGEGHVRLKPTGELTLSRRAKPQTAEEVIQKLLERGWRWRD